MLVLFLLFPLYSYSAVDKEIIESDKCSRIIPYFEQKYQIPRNTLYSIALKESGKKHSKHKIAVIWPWTVNVEGTGYFFNTKKEAILFVKRQIIMAKESIDVGCMQINLKHHLGAFDSLNQAFDPKYNVEYGAKFLKAKYEQLGSWHKAIAHYHSANNELGFKYRQGVVKIANNIHSYKNSLSKYSSQNYYNEVDILPQNQTIVAISTDKKNTSSFNKNIKKYQSNLMVVIPRNHH
jgi:soluble lytic murein transglycosylase-like protein